jgi:hypothetical protein
MKIAVRAESFKYLSTFIVIYLLQRCQQTIVRLVLLSVLHFNIFSNRRRNRKKRGVEEMEVKKERELSEVNIRIASGR